MPSYTKHLLRPLVLEQFGAPGSLDKYTDEICILDILTQCNSALTVKGDSDGYCNTNSNKHRNREHMLKRDLEGRKKIAGIRVVLKLKTRIVFNY